MGLQIYLYSACEKLVEVGMFQPGCYITRARDIEKKVGKVLREYNDLRLAIIWRRNAACFEYIFCLPCFLDGLNNVSYIMTLSFSWIRTLDFQFLLIPISYCDVRSKFRSFPHQLSVSHQRLGALTKSINLHATCMLSMGLPEYPGDWIEWIKYLSRLDNAHSRVKMVCSIFSSSHGVNVPIKHIFLVLFLESLRATSK